MRRLTLRRLKDRLARVFVSAGGLAIIASILGILVFLLLEVHPLWTARTYSPEPARSFVGDARALTVDPYQTHLAVLLADGTTSVLRLVDGSEAVRARVVPESATLDKLDAASPTLFAASASDGTIHGIGIEFDAGFDGASRVVTPRLTPIAPFVMDPQRRPLLAFSLRRTSGGYAAAAQLQDGTIAVVVRTVTSNALGGDPQAEEQRITTVATQRCSHLLLDHEAHDLYGGTREGIVCWWPIAEGKLETLQVIPASESAISSLALLIGERSLIVGAADGALTQWFQVRQGESARFQLTRIRAFDAMRGPVLAIAPAQRHKGFLALGAGGQVGAFYATTGARRWLGESGIADAAAIGFAPKVDSAFVAGRSSFARIAIADPHPEVSLGVLFGNVWYENGERPEMTWQSTAGTDEFEPKLSFVPLVFGTLKGTLVSLLLAVPLAVLAAMYVAHFMHPDLKRYVKPAIELMAALPSVVLGFVAARWLAPRVESGLMALLIAPLVLPALVLAAGMAGRLVPRERLARFPVGGEAFVYALVLVIGAWLCCEIAPLVERAFFSGSLVAWLGSALHVRYEQQNALVVGLAMSFAVIQIIFSIAEEAFSNVPKSLVSGSLALGATRWQTVTRVVLPSASPGIFSAIMVGFGRAVGETMIVVMATGGTAILDWRPWNGFRALSYTIANEVVEAPNGGTLYRVLFLAALLLFAFTFAANTVAEVVRQRLRVRYEGL